MRWPSQRIAVNIAKLHKVLNDALGLSEIYAQADVGGGAFFVCQVAFAQGRQLGPCSGRVFQPLLVGWFRRPRRQIATLLGVLPVFRHDPHSVEILCRS